MSALRATASLRNQAGPKFASPHKYTYVEGRTPFWRKFREMFSVNPEISSGLPDPRMNRTPTPASRPEKAAIFPSKASDIAGNLYHDRDTRRKYQRLSYVTQQDLTQLLLASPNEDGTKTLAPPGEADASGSTALARPTDLSSPSAFTDVLAQVHSSSAVTTAAEAGQHHYSSANLPPAAPSTIGRRPQHVLKEVESPPHAEHAYYPARNFA